MRVPIWDSWGCRLILPSAAVLAVTTGVNLMKNNQAIKRVWSFNYHSLNWILDIFNLIYFITVLFYFILSQASITIEPTLRLLTSDLN